jgi:hypothetical protein
MTLIMNIIITVTAMAMAIRTGIITTATVTASVRL